MFLKKSISYFMNIVYKRIFLNSCVISFINKEMVSLFQLHTYKFGLVYICTYYVNIICCSYLIFTINLDPSRETFLQSFRPGKAHHHHDGEPQLPVSLEISDNKISHISRKPYFSLHITEFHSQCNSLFTLE